MYPEFALPEKDSDGKYPAFAWPGGYPLFYLDKTNNVLCADCASKEDEYTEPTVACDVNYEDAHMFCDDCGTRIESAYAEDDDDDDGNE